jgi:hypothetical protein
VFAAHAIRSRKTCDCSAAQSMRPVPPRLPAHSQRTLVALLVVLVVIVAALAVIVLIVLLVVVVAEVATQQLRQAGARLALALLVILVICAGQGGGGSVRARLGVQVRLTVTRLQVASTRVSHVAGSDPTPASPTRTLVALLALGLCRA